MDTSMLDNHPALQAIRENETDDEIEQIQVKAVGPLHRGSKLRITYYLRIM